MQHQRRKEFLVQHKAVTEKKSPCSTIVVKNSSFNVIIDETKPDVTSLGERIQD